MKTLRDFIKQTQDRKWKSCNVNGLQSIDEFLEVNSLTEIDNGIWFRYFDSLNENREYDTQFDWQNFIYETLIKSHNSDILTKKLKDTFEDIIEIENFKLINHENVNSLRIYIEKSKDILTDNRFVKLIELFNYFISKIEKRNGIEVILLEPVFGNNLDSYIENECEGIVYHITNKNNRESILKLGIRSKGYIDLSKKEKINIDLKNDNNWYRKFPKRIYFIANGKNFRNDIFQLMRDKNLTLDTMSIFKCKIDRKYLSLYNDPLYESKNFCYGYGFMHPNQIEEITNIENFLK